MQPCGCVKFTNACIAYHIALMRRIIQVKKDATQMTRYRLCEVRLTLTASLWSCSPHAQRVLSNRTAKLNPSQPMPPVEVRNVHT